MRPAIYQRRSLPRPRALFRLTERNCGRSTFEAGRISHREISRPIRDFTVLRLEFVSIKVSYDRRFERNLGDVRVHVGAYRDP